MENNRLPLEIGPHFVSAQSHQDTSSTLQYLGVELEFAGETVSGRLPLYFQPAFALPKLAIQPALKLENTVIPADRLPCDFDFTPWFETEGSPPEHVPLESFLVGLYRNFNVARPIWQVLRELRSLLAFQNRKVITGLLRPAAEAQGYVVTADRTVEDKRFLEVGWLTPEDRESQEIKAPFHVCVIEQTKTASAWLEPRQTGICVLLFERLRQDYREPQDVLAI